MRESIMQTKARVNIRKQEANVSLEWALHRMRHNVEDVKGPAFLVSFALF